MTAIIQRFGQGASALVAAILDLGVVFNILKWDETQIASVNLVALLVVGIIFGAGVRSASTP